MVQESQQLKAATGECNPSALLGNATIGAFLYFSYLDTVPETGLCNEQSKNNLSLTRWAGKIHSKANEILGVRDGNVFSLQFLSSATAQCWFLMRRWALGVCPGRWEKQGLCRSSVPQQWDQSEPGLEMNSFTQCQADFVVNFRGAELSWVWGPAGRCPSPEHPPLHQPPLCTWLIIPSLCWLIFLDVHLQQERTFLFNDSSFILSLPSFWQSRVSASALTPGSKKWLCCN